MSKVIQVSVASVDNNSTTQCNYVVIVLLDNGRVFKNDDTHPEWIEMNLPAVTTI